MKIILVPVFALMVLAASSGGILAAEDGPVIIRNSFLEVRADRATGRITILANGKTILSDGRIGKEDLSGVSLSSTKIAQIDQIILIQHKDGQQDSITLPKDLPWAFLQTYVVNTGKESLVVNRTPLFQAKVDFGHAVDQLKILGTGGLSKPGRQIGSYMWLAAAEPKSRNGIVAGFLTTQRGSGVVFAEAKEKQLQIKAQLEHGRLTVKPGEMVELETFAIGYFDDVRLGLEAWADEVARRHKIKLPPQPCGYCTWYHAGSSNETAMVKQTEIAAKELAPFGFNFMQIDDGWQDGVSKNGPKKNFTRVQANGPYPAGMKKTADMIRGHGLTPGIWFMPFAGTWNDPWFKDHQDWFAKRVGGKPFDTSWGGTCMDMTNPDARKYLHDYVVQMSHDWGYRFFKMDGLSTGAVVSPQYVNLGYKDDHLGDAVLHDPNKTNIEAYRSGLELVREAAGKDVFLLGCCAAQNMRSYGGAFGLVDAMRVGPDNGGDDWNSVLTGPLIASRHYHLNGRVWYNDPDVVYVRPSLSLDQARANASWVAITGQLFMVSDDFTKLKPERLEVLKRVMPAHGRQARPVDLLEEEIPRIWLVTDNRGGIRRDVIGLFNWDNKPWNADYALDRVGLPESKRYVAFDFWGNRLLPPVEGRLKVTLPPTSCMILAVRPESDHPQVISTSRHVTQGMVDLPEEKWDASTKTLSGQSKVVAGDPHEIRIALGAESTRWHVTRTQANSGPATVALSQEKDLIRVLIKTATGGDIEWSVQFAKDEATE
ncbi:MAG: glycoside hydrolase family 36 protein [Planctomycetota bacterium]